MARVISHLGAIVITLWPRLASSMGRPVHEREKGGGRKIERSRFERRHFD